MKWKKTTQKTIDLLNVNKQNQKTNNEYGLQPQITTINLIVYSTGLWQLHISCCGVKRVGVRSLLLTSDRTETSPHNKTIKINWHIRLIQNTKPTNKKHYGHKVTKWDY